MKYLGSSPFGVGWNRKLDAEYDRIFGKKGRKRGAGARMDGAVGAGTGRVVDVFRDGKPRPGVPRRG
jgi:hypothetical protein